jgi:hypothetical protein
MLRAIDLGDPLSDVSEHPGVPRAQGRRRRGSRPSGSPPQAREHVPEPAPAVNRAGSPPQARGARRPLAIDALDTGITLAGAGSTLTSRGREPGRSDHPRGRGEHELLCRVIDSWDGSPPRARGAHRLPGLGGRLPGITPAGAGSTGRTRHRSRRGPDHPRGRGEHAIAQEYVSRAEGSPPRARGAHLLICDSSAPSGGFLWGRLERSACWLGDGRSACGCRSCSSLAEVGSLGARS